MLFLISCTKEVIEPKSYIVKVVFNNVAVSSQEMITTRVYPLKIESIVLSEDLNFKAKCWIDNSKVIVSSYSPHQIRLDTRNFDIGTHILYLKIFYEEKEIGNIQYTFTLVDDIPKYNELGTYTKIFKCN